MTPERLQEIRERLRMMGYAHSGWASELLAHIDAQEAEIAALRRGQGRAPAPAEAGPVATPLHEAHPIPDSTRRAP